MRVYAGKAVGAALYALRARAVAADFLLATWRAGLAESAAGRRARRTLGVLARLTFDDLVWARHCHCWRISGKVE